MQHMRDTNTFNNVHHYMTLSVTTIKPLRVRKHFVLQQLGTTRWQIAKEYRGGGMGLKKSGCLEKICSFNN